MKIVVVIIKVGRNNIAWSIQTPMGLEVLVPLATNLIILNIDICIGIKTVHYRHSIPKTVLVDNIVITESRIFMEVNIVLVSLIHIRGIFRIKGNGIGVIKVSPNQAIT